LLTLPAGAFPFVCRRKESAALVLLLLSALTVVLAVGNESTGGDDALGPEDEDPQATRIARDPARSVSLA
jgi:hypothetical protein